MMDLLNDHGCGPAHGDRGGYRRLQRGNDVVGHSAVLEIDDFMRGWRTWNTNGSNMVADDRLADPLLTHGRNRVQQILHPELDLLLLLVFDLRDVGIDSAPHGASDRSSSQRADGGPEQRFIVVFTDCGSHCGTRQASHGRTAIGVRLHRATAELTEEGATDGCHDRQQGSSASSGKGWSI
jgi:hypothetical protein